MAAAAASSGGGRPPRPAAVTIRAASPADEDKLVALGVSTGLFTKAEADELLRSSLQGIFDGRSSPSSHFARVATVAPGPGAELAGWTYAAADPAAGPAIWELYWIGVAHTYEGQGYGAALLADSERAAKAAGARELVIATSSTGATARARAFYQRHGYKEVDRTPDYYGAGDDKVTYKKALTGHAAPSLLPPPAARAPPRLGPPYTLGEDIFALPCGALKALLDCFLTRETRELRAVSADARAHVADHSWDDYESVVTHPRRWRACFPRACAACLAPKRSKLHGPVQHWKTADFAPLRGVTRLSIACSDFQDLPACLATLEGRLHTLDAGGVTFSEAALAQVVGVQDIRLDGYLALTDAGLACLAGATSVSLSGRMGVTDEGLRALAGVTKLNISCCARVTGSCFEALTSLKELRMSGCDAVTPASLRHLSRLEVLDISGCTHIFDGAFAPLAASLKELVIDKCVQLGDAAFAHFAGLKKLSMVGCLRFPNDAAFVHLGALEELDMSGCAQPRLTDAALAGLRKLRKLNMSGCSQLSDAALTHLGGALLELNASYCSKLTDAAFRPLPRLQKLKIVGCSKLTDACLAPLARTLRELDMAYCESMGSAGVAKCTQLRVLRCEGCNQDDFGDAAFVGLVNLRELDMSGCRYSKFTNACLRPLRGRSLSKLSIMGCGQLTDSVLDGIEGLSSLVYEGSQVTKRAAKRVVRWL